MEAIIQNVEDFVITGKGTSGQWEKAEWLNISSLVKNTLNYGTKAKILWSDYGIYFLFDCEDRILSCTKTKDFDELYLEDVIEIFLWPDESQVVYFEYQISPLGYELPLIVSNSNGRYHGWLPFKYINERRILSRTWVYGGKKTPKAAISGWRAEFLIPFELLLGLNKCPPEPHTCWRANMCRLDYDTSLKNQWSWCEVADDFHNIHKFGKLIFKK